MRRRQSGSAFVDSVIAAAIVVMAMGAVLNAVADSASHARRAEARRLALLVAQSEMSAVGADVPLEVGETSGAAGDLLWRVQVSPYAGGAGGGLLKVRVDVGRRGEGPPLASLESLRAGPPA